MAASRWLELIRVTGTLSAQLQIGNFISRVNRAEWLWRDHCGIRSPVRSLFANLICYFCTISSGGSARRRGIRGIHLHVKRQCVVGWEWYRTSTSHRSDGRSVTSTTTRGGHIKYSHNHNEAGERSHKPRMFLGLYQVMAFILTYRTKCAW
jgi:hypothetical protein